MLEGGGGAIKHLPHQEVTLRPKNTKQATPHHLHSSVQGNSTTGSGSGSQAVQCLLGSCSLGSLDCIEGGVASYLQ